MGSEDVGGNLHGKLNGNHNPRSFICLNPLKLLNGEQALNSLIRYTEETKRQVKEFF
jgi:hypothetical protein